MAYSPVARLAQNAAGTQLSVLKGCKGWAT